MLEHMRLLRQFLVALFRLAVAAFAIAGTFEAWTGEIPAKFVYFTFQTNIALGIVMAWAGLATLLRGIQPPAWLKGCLTLYAVITGLIAWLILDPADPATTPVLWGMMTSTMVHIIVPIGAALDFLLFDPHRRLTWLHAVQWLIYFPLYLGFVLIRAQIAPHSGPGNGGDPYPYPFINLPNIGWQQFLINIVVYAAAFLVLGLIIVGIDKALPAKALVNTARSGK